MKRQLLGRVSALLLMPLFLFADVKVLVDKNALYRGDSVEYTITVTGSDIEFPNITEIGGNPIESTAKSQNIKLINGDFEKSIAQSYRFAPKASLEIPSYKVLVDGGVEMTRAVPIKIVEPSQDKTAPIVLDINLSKKSVHVGEMVRFDLIFKKKPNVPVYKFDIEEPKFEDFWVKKLDGVKEGVDGEYTTRTYSYILFAQKSGTLTIPAVMAQIGQISHQRRSGLDPFFNSAFGQEVHYTKVFSNALDLDVKSLPGDLELYGDFTISAEVDKTTVSANKPVNLTVSVKGIGNIDDVQKFAFDIPGAVIYANEPVLKTAVHDKEYGGTFTQKIVIIADSSYTIAPLTLRYVDKTTQKAVVRKSAPIEIKVTGGSVNTSTIQSAPESTPSAVASGSENGRLDNSIDVKNRSWIELLYAGLIGFVIGAFSVCLLLRKGLKGSNNQQSETPIAKKIKQAKGDKALFELLLPYKKESETVDKALEELEDNLYHGASHKVDKKVLIQYLSADESEMKLV